MKIDMSPSAVDTRLRMVEQLRRLCLSLKAAGEAHRKSKTKHEKEARDKNFTVLPK